MVWLPMSTHLLDGLQKLGLGGVASLDGLIQGLRGAQTQDVTKQCDICGWT